jgi:alpha-galactosidase
VHILNDNSFLSNYGGFTGHKDPDMLEVGNGNRTTAETRTHFALWAIMKAPLIIGTDLSNLSQTNIDILQNRYLLAFNQDPVYGGPAQPYKWGVNPDWTFSFTAPAEYWSGLSTNGTIVAMFNVLAENRTMTADFSEIPGLNAGGTYCAIDVWSGDDLGEKQGSFNLEVETHDTAVFLLQEC